MKQRILLLGLGAASSLVISTSPAHASDVLGTYARVDKVTYTPDEKNATKVQIDGVFALNSGAGAYKPAAPGYMYFQCKAGEEVTCRLQWADIAAAIGTKDCAGFGQRNIAPGTVRAKGTTPATPDTYDLGIGVIRTPFALGVCDGLQNYKEPLPGDAGATDAAAPVPADSGASSSGSSGSSSGTTPAPTGTTNADPKPSTSNGCNQAGSDAPWSLGLVGLAALGLLARKRRT